MPEKNKPIPHPDDFMVVTIGLELRAKANPDFDDPSELGIIAHKRVLATTRAEEYLAQVLNAIRDRRLYGLMAQSAAESSVGCGEWIATEINDLIADIRTRSSENESPQSNDQGKPA